MDGRVISVKNGIVNRVNIFPNAKNVGLTTMMNRMTTKMMNKNKYKNIIL
jgi:hypothetical protein